MMIINEGPKTYYARNLKNGGMSVYPSRKGLPNLIVDPEDGDLKTANKYVAIVVKTRTLEKLYKEERTKQLYKHPFDSGILELRNAVFSDQAPMYRLAMQQYPNIFKIVKLNSRAQFYKFITVDMRIPVQAFIAWFGGPPTEGLEAHAEKFHNALLYLPDNMRASNKKAALDLLETIFQILKAHGFGFLFHGEIRVVKLPSNHGGEYFQTTKDIRIQPTIKKTKSSIYTLLHEFGHKYWYEYMTQGQRTKVTEKFYELISQGEEFKSYKNDKRPKAIDELKQKIQPGLKIIYKGRKKSYKDNSPFVIDRIGDEKLHAVPETRVGRLLGITVFYDTLLDFSKWEVMGVDLHNKPEKPENIKYNNITSDWFPTEYSIKNIREWEHEWWAESFAHYMLDHLHGSPVDFLEEVLGV